MPPRCLCMILSATALALLSSGAILAEDSNKSQAHATIRPSLTGGPYSVAAINDPPIEQWLHQILDEPVPRLDFPGATPLSEILDAITTHFNEKHNVKPRTKTGASRFMFYPDQGELALEQIDSLEDVAITDIRFEGIKLRNALELIFDQTSDDTKSPVPLGFVIQHEVILITTKSRATAGTRRFVRAYRVDTLINSVGDFNSGTIDRLLVDMTPDLHWETTDEGSAGSIRRIGRTLVVNQTANGHERIVGLLNMLAIAEGTGKPAAIKAPVSTTLTRHSAAERQAFEHTPQLDPHRQTGSTKDEK